MFVSVFLLFFFFFFFNDTATTEIYTLSLHDALPIWQRACSSMPGRKCCSPPRWPRSLRDRKSTRLNSSHSTISYAVFCLKKKTIATTGFCSSTESPRVHPYYGQRQVD